MRWWDAFLNIRKIPIFANLLNYHSFKHRFTVVHESPGRQDSVEKLFIQGVWKNFKPHVQVFL